jgi:DUF971 family protein
METMTSATPKIITRSDPKVVVIEWTDGTVNTFTAADLRACCPCARCVHELTGERMHDPATVPADLTQSDLRMVGNYAISMLFSDGHNTGIFTFPFLQKIPAMRQEAQAREQNRPRSASEERGVADKPGTAHDHGQAHGAHTHHKGCNHGPFDGAREPRDG